MKTTSLTIRYVIYSIFLIIVLLTFRGISHPSNFLLEAGPMELIQEVILLTITAGFSILAYRYPGWLSMLAFFAFFSGALFIRELDQYLDRLNPFWGWKLFMAVLVMSCSVHTATSWSSIRKRLEEFLHTRSMAILWCGFLFVVFFAQLIGDASMIESVFGADYERDMKRYHEEMTEFVGYLLLLVGMVETRFEIRHKKNGIRTDETQ